MGVGIHRDVFPKEQPRHLAKNCNSMAEGRSAGVPAGKRGEGRWGGGVACQKIPGFILKSKIVAFCLNILSYKQVNKLICSVYLNQIATEYGLF